MAAPRSFLPLSPIARQAFIRRCALPGHRARIEALLSQGVDPNYSLARGGDASSPLASALLHARWDNALALLPYCSEPLRLWAEPRGAISPFHAMAAGLAYMERPDGIELARQLAQALIARGASLDELGSDGLTPLLFSSLPGVLIAREPSSPHAPLGFFLDLGANPNALGSEGQSPLMALAAINALPGVERCLARGADDSIINANGRCALAIALSLGHPHCALALARAASPAALATRDLDGRSALGLACSLCSPERGAELIDHPARALEIIGTLASRGLSFFEPSLSGERPLDALRASASPAFQALAQSIEIDLACRDPLAPAAPTHRPKRAL